MMKVKIHKCFVSLISRKEGPFFIVPHSGLALDNPEGEIDTGTQSVAYHYIKKYGGSAILSLFSREKEIGIDFWRPIPKDAKRSRRYAWFHTSRKEDEEKKKVYKKFWDLVLSQKSDTIIALHRQLPRVKNHPSMIDIISFNGKGFSKKRMRKIIDEVNKRYKNMFYSMMDDYRELMLIHVDYLFLKHKKNIMKEFKKDLKVLNSSGILKEKNITKTIFKEAIIQLLQKEPNLKITLERNFTGKYVGDIIDPLFKDRLVIEFEINQLLSEYYPSLASQIVHDIISGYRRISK